MIRFSCSRSPKERLKIWLEQPRQLKPVLLETIVDMMRDSLRVKERWFSTNLPNNDYFCRAKAYLKEKGECDAVVSLLRDPKTNQIIRGGTRIPLKVKTKEQEYIIKPYDNVDASSEKEILKVVGGKIAPEVFHLGDEFYSEEFIAQSHSLYQAALGTGAFSQEKRKELWEYCFGNKGDDQETRMVFMSDMVTAIKPMILQGAQMHADLAKLKIIYDHNHWLDEFRVVNGRPIITDFGTAHFFLEPGQGEENLPGLQRQFEDLTKEYLLCVENDEKKQVRQQREILGRRIDHVEQYRVMYERISRRGVAACLQGYYFEEKNRQKAALGGLASASMPNISYLCEHPDLTANLLLALDTATEGIKSFFENVAVASGCPYLRLAMPDFATAFFKRYLS